MNNQNYEESKQEEKNFLAEKNIGKQSQSS